MAFSSILKPTALTELLFADFFRIKKVDAGTLDFEAIQRLAETSPHLLEDIGIRADDPRFRPDLPETKPSFGR